MKQNQFGWAKHFTMLWVWVGLFLLMMQGCKPSQNASATPLSQAEQFLKQGQFQQVIQTLTTSNPQQMTPEADFDITVSEIALGQKPDFQRLSTLSLEKRAYLLSLLALFSPQTALDYLHSRPTLEPSEASSAVLALRVQNQSQAEIAKQEEAWIYPVSEYEKTAQALKPPGFHEKLPVFREKVKVFTTTTIRLRRELTSAIQDKPAEIQLRIMELDRALEEKAGEFLRKVPVAPGLKGMRAKQYKEGLTREAQVYLDRANEISKLEAPLRDRLKASSPKQPAMDRWPWPKEFIAGQGGFAPIAQACSDKNYVGALILADLLRTEVLKSDVDYFSVRTGLLLLQAGTQPQSDAIRNFAFDELSNSKQDGLILQWKSLTS